MHAHCSALAFAVGCAHQTLSWGGGRVTFAALCYAKGVTTASDVISRQSNNKPTGPYSTAVRARVKQTRTHTHACGCVCVEHGFRVPTVHPVLFATPRGDRVRYYDVYFTAAVVGYTNQSVLAVQHVHEGCVCKIRSSRFFFHSK